MADPTDTIGAAAGVGPEMPPPGSAVPGAPEPEPAEEPGAKSESLIDAIADLLQMLVNYLRQEASELMRDKFVLPAQKVGAMIAFAFAAAFLLALGLGFIAVALLLLLSKWLTWPGALGLIGVLLVAGAAVATMLKVRSTQT
jgi:hypothetical protein